MSTKTVLPFRPEPIEQLRARLPTALARRFDADVIAPAVLAGKGDVVETPDQLPAHTFDFLDGLRLIVSVDLMTPLPIGAAVPPGIAQQVWLHVSACLNLDDPTVRERRVPGGPALDTLAHVRELIPATAGARPTAYVCKGAGMFGGDAAHLMFRLQ